MTVQFIRHLFVFCMLVLAGSMLSACGRKGPLYIATPTPAQEPTSKTQPAESKPVDEADKTGQAKDSNKKNPNKITK